MRLYLAGPLFTAGERLFNNQLGLALQKAGHDVCLPQEEEVKGKTASEIFTHNVEKIDWADVVVANMDGSDPDSGTSWECGYAFRKKPVIVFRTDFRVGEEQKLAPYNVMLWVSATEHLDLPFGTVEDVANSLIAILALRLQ